MLRLRSTISMGLATAALVACSSGSNDAGHIAGDRILGGTSEGGTTTGYNIDLSQTSTSGLSSGAFMAVQFHVAFSSIMKGAAIFAGGPFSFAQGSIANAYTQCMYPTSAPSVTPFVNLTKQYAAAGTIDDPSNLASQRVFLFGGADDDTVNPVVMDALQTYYATFMSSSSIFYQSRNPGTAHTMPTLDYGGDCDQTVSPWIGDCDYDGAGKALTQIYGTLAAPATTLSGTVISIPQGNFIADPASHSLADTAYAYVPASCASGALCRIHVAFHGCEQEATGGVGSDFYLHAGYNVWADTNNIIVLYPQTIASNSSPSNPDACWDWWGYDSADYSQQTGPQMAMVRAMLGFFASGGTVDGGSTPPPSGDSGTADAAAPPPPPPPAPTATCYVDNNYDQVVAGRATQSLGEVYANGSHDSLGLFTLATITSLKETSPGYYVVGSCP
jgi:poly(3-hydroxybutyrate) depolymerase